MPFRFRIGDQVVNFDNMAPGADELDELIDVDVESVVSGSVLSYDGVEWIPLPTSYLLGPTGPQGPTGPAGPAGATGPMGPTGPMGGSTLAYTNTTVSGGSVSLNTGYDFISYLASGTTTVNLPSAASNFGKKFTVFVNGMGVVVLQETGGDIFYSISSAQQTLAGGMSATILAAPGPLGNGWYLIGTNG